MGQGCSSAPRIPPLRSSRSPASDNRSSTTSQAGANAASAALQTQLCSHNVCSILRKKDWDSTERMLTTGEGMDINLTKFLERALYEGCPSRLVDMILAKGANPLDSSRCLSDAVLGNVEHKMIKRLLDLGCSPNQESDQDKLKRTPMHFACQTPTPLDIIDLLIEYGGDLNLAVGDRLWTPIHYLACANPDSDVLKRICERGGEVNARASDGTTPMAVAAFKRAPEKFFRAMLDVGADPAIETRTGRNPLYYIRNNEEPRVSAGDVRLLLLDPKIHLNQLKTLAKSLHKRLGQKSDARRLNPDILIYVGEFLIGKKVSKCELSHLDTDGGDAVHPPPQ